MMTIILITLKGISRDRLFQGIMSAVCGFLLIPVIASLSMLQVTEWSLPLSLSLISIIQLLLAEFLGGTSLWKDIERRYTFSVLGLPHGGYFYLEPDGKVATTSKFTFGAAKSTNSKISGEPDERH